MESLQQMSLNRKEISFSNGNSNLLDGVDWVTKVVSRILWSGIFCQCVSNSMILLFFFNDLLLKINERGASCASSLYYQSYILKKKDRQAIE